MEYIILFLLIMNIVITLFSIFKAPNNDIEEKIGRLEINIIKELENLKTI